MQVRAIVTTCLVTSAALGLVLLPMDAQARRGKRKAKTQAPVVKVDTRGSLFIMTTTAGAKIEIDGEPAGELSLEETPRKMAPGQHTIRVHKRGWTEYIDTFIIRKGQETEMEVDLIPVAGIVKVQTSLPGATVKANGKVLGVTGKKVLDRDVAAGDVVLEISRPGYQSVTKTFKITAGKVLPTLTVTLEPIVLAAAPAFYEAWWFWSIVGVAVAGGTTATVLMVQGDGPQPPTPDFTLQIP